ncbi:TPA: hypothetical protein ACX13R_003343 [Citrobacter amalonaticus]
MWYKFIMPLGPFFYLYAKTSKEKISWLLYYVMPFISIVLFYDVKPVAACIAILLIYSAYDIGYIYNNAETIKREDNPTLRFTEFDLQFYERNKIAIYALKILISLFLAFLLYYLYGYAFSVWLLCIVMLIGFFYIYNTTRGVSNFYLQFVLSFTRFTLPLFILTHYDLTTFVISILIFPLPNFLERTKIKKNNLPFTIHNTALFRFFYYLVLLLLVIVFSFVMKILSWEWPVLICGYFFSYRTLFYIFEKVNR